MTNPQPQGSPYPAPTNLDKAVVGLLLSLGHQTVTDPGVVTSALAEAQSIVDRWSI